MIRLQKGPVPQVLVRLGASWTQVLLGRLASGQKPTDDEKGRYRHPEIKAALLKETYGKCAYCESKVLHIAHGDIDHVIPKSVEPQKAFDWNNLTISCDKCNENKSSTVELLDPYIHDPNEHIFFYGPLLLPVPGSDLGTRTEIVLKLNRIDLLERRLEKIKRLHKSLDALARIKDAQTKEIVRQDLIANETVDSQEFSALARHFIHKTLAGRI